MTENSIEKVSPNNSRDAAVQSNPIYKNPVRHIPKTGTFRYIMQKEPVQSGT